MLSSLMSKGQPVSTRMRLPLSVLPAMKSRLIKKAICAYVKILRDGLMKSVNRFGSAQTNIVVH